jgi:RNA polymerase sigma factor for flagellar operon FliA
MLDQQNYEALFIAHFDLIGRVAAIVCRRHGIYGDDADDFAASARMKLIENDYAALRRFRGDATIQTYLTTVITRHLHDLTREHRGRWRTSAEAERLGPPAGELEALVYRDGLGIGQAGERLRTAGRTELSDRELASILARLPQRAPLRPVQVSAESALSSAEASSRADERVEASEAEARRERLNAAINRAMAGLTWQERTILRMRYADGISVADVARALGLDQKALYRRVERLRARLREHLEQEGVGSREVREILGGEEAE